MSSFSVSATHTGESGGPVVTSMKLIFLQFSEIANDDVGIRATNVALGLRRLPSGFYAVLHHSGLEWRTENKPSSANDDVVEWSGPIPM